MRNVKIDREKLLAIVKENKAKHVVEHLSALQDYKEAVTKICKFNLDEIDIDRVDKLKEIPARPQSYETSYARAIRMLELSADIIIELDESTFNQLVLDEWVWKSSFSASNASYKSLV